MAAKHAANNKENVSKEASPTRRNKAVSSEKAVGGTLAAYRATIENDAKTEYSRDAWYDGYAKRKKSKRVWTAVLVIALVVFVGSVAALGAIAFSYWQGQKAYERVESIAAVQFGAQDIASDGEPSQAFDLASVTVDWKALSEVNSDIVAWIYIPNTSVNYPVVHGSDDEYYLYHDFEGTQGGLTQSGCIFMKAANNPAFTDMGTFLFGHHLNDGSMFSVIADEGTFADGRPVYIFTPRGNMMLRPFALVHCAGTDTLVQTEFESKSALTSYIADKINRSVIALPQKGDPSSIDRFIALSTCDNLYTDGRYILFCSIEQET